MVTRELIEKLVGPSWVDFMAPFMQSDAFTNMLGELKAEKERVTPLNQAVLPLDQQQIFRAFRETPLDTVRVIIIGQDPYPARAAANGLAFAVNKDVEIPGSLRKVLRAIEVDCYDGKAENLEARFDRTLKFWTDQGILLLNTALTVVEGDPKSHLRIWKPFIDYVINKMDLISKRLIWVAWGTSAQDYVKNVRVYNQFVITHEHPSRALRENREWECKHFSLINTIITHNHLGNKIDWLLPF